MTRYLLPMVFAIGLAATGAEAQVPRPAPEYAYKLADGTQQLLSKYRGKVVAVEFLSTHCPHCQQSAQVLEKLYKEYGPKGFQPVGIAVNPDAEKLLPDFTKRFGLTHPIGVGNIDTAQAYMQHPAGKRFLVPNIVLIDRKGTIQAVYRAGDAMFSNEENILRTQIEKLLAQPATAKRRSRRK